MIKSYKAQVLRMRENLEKMRQAVASLKQEKKEIEKINLELMK